MDANQILNVTLYVAGAIILLALALLVGSRALRAAVRTWQSTPHTELDVIEPADIVIEKTGKPQSAVRTQRFDQDGQAICVYCDSLATKFAPSIVEEQGVLQWLGTVLPMEMIPPRYRRGSIRFPCAKYCVHHGAMAEHEIDMWLAREQNDLVKFFRDRSVRAAKFQTEGLQKALDVALDVETQPAPPTTKRLKQTNRRSNVTALPARASNS